MYTNTRVTIFPAGHRQDIAQSIISQPGFHPEGSIDDFYGAIIWTEPDPQDAYPGQLVINTKAQRRVYLKPRLLSIFGNTVLLSVLEDSPSGTMRAPRLLHILLREYHPT